MLKQQNFFDRNIPAWKQVLFLSWPTIVELLLQTAINYVADTRQLSRATRARSSA